MFSNISSFIVLIALHHGVSAIRTSVPLDTIVIQLRSKADSDNSALLDEVRRLTNRFIDDYFGAYYATREQNEFFEGVQIDADSFGIQGSNGSFINAFQFEGNVTFNSDSSPSQSFIGNLLANAFKGINLELYLENLLLSNDPFLKSLIQAFVEIDGTPITHTSLEDSSIGSQGSGHGWDLHKWAEVAVFVTAGVVGAMVVLGVFCLWNCYCTGRKIHNEGSTIKIRKVEFSSTDNSKVISQSLKPSDCTGRRKNGNRTREPSMSPSRSIVSQDSSLFTYNPAGISKDLATFSLGSISNINIETPNFDLEAWQRQNTISSVAQAPFGQDISAIEQRDHLSILEDGDASALRTRGSKRLQPKKSRTSSCENRHPGTRQYVQSSYTTNTIQEGNGRESSSEESTSCSSDVISDLRDLSLQIDRHRRSRASPYYQE